jgi:hypothetical protein
MSHTARKQDDDEICTACRTIGMLENILESTFALADGLGVDLEDTSGGPWWHEEAAEGLKAIAAATFALADELGIDLLKDEDHEDART